MKTSTLRLHAVDWRLYNKRTGDLASCDEWLTRHRHWHILCGSAPAKAPRSTREGHNIRWEVPRSGNRDNHH